MDWNSLATLLQTFAFPVLACIGMGWYIITIHEKIRQTVEKNTEAIIKLIETFRQE